MIVTVIIPYKVDRGWLRDAIKSVPDYIQLILSQGDGNWPQNFNKALPKAKGEFIRYLHEDDMLTSNCICDSVVGLKSVDFIHGNAIEIHQRTGKQVNWIPLYKTPTVTDLLRKNVIHSVTTMYRREVFEKLGGFNEDPKMYSFEEYEFHLRCLAAGFKIGYVDSFLGYYRRHPKQIIRTVDQRQRQICREELVTSYNK
jgi:hypothetical protein